MKVGRSGNPPVETCSLSAGKCEHQALDIVKMEGYPNGEITFDPATNEYTVWNETYSDPVCITNYPKVAEAALTAYGKHYLQEEQENKPDQTEIFTQVIEFAIETDEPKEFLRCWLEGDWQAIKDEWPEFKGYLG